jgi:hypothetical protein
MWFVFIATMWTMIHGEAIQHLAIVVLFDYTQRNESSLDHILLICWFQDRLLVTHNGAKMNK